MDKHEFREMLNWDQCAECGECLVNCRYMNFSRVEAIEEIKKVNSERPSKAVDGCMSCYACNAFCPHDAHPYERIHYTWNNRYVDKGLPARAAYLMPSKRPNFRQDLSYSPLERELHTKWSAPDPPSKTVLYPGCNLMAVPFLATGQMFETLPVWGRWDLCCGEMYFRMGVLDPVKKTAELLTRFYHGKGLEEMVFLCPACYNMFTHILPDQFGAVFDFKTTFFTDWFFAQLASGGLQINSKLSGQVVIHDSCHGRVLGEAFMDKQRELLHQLGLHVHETEYNRSNGLCCGVAAACRKYSVLDVITSGMKGLRALDKAQGAQAAIYCTGCYLTLSCIRLLNPFGKPLYHFLEYIHQAVGDNPTRNNMQRAFSLVKGLSLHALPGYLNPNRFYLE